MSRGGEGPVQLRKTFSSLPSSQRSTSSTPCINEWSWLPISYFRGSEAAAREDAARLEVLVDHVVAAPQPNPDRAWISDDVLR
jgi:hypothetical protein